MLWLFQKPSSSLIYAAEIVSSTFRIRTEESCPGGGGLGLLASSLSLSLSQSRWPASAYPRREGKRSLWGTYWELDPRNPGPPKMVSDVQNLLQGEPVVPKHRRAPPLSHFSFLGGRRASLQRLPVRQAHLLQGISAASSPRWHSVSFLGVIGVDPGYQEGIWFMNKRNEVDRSFTSSLPSA